MSKSNPALSTKLILWGKAAGRCQYDGCNKTLFQDALTKGEFNQSYIAHIIADEEKGPRGDKILSPKLAKDISNLMLLCDAHHRLIDKIDVAGHTIKRLREMKSKHEDRIELLTNITPDKQSHMVLLGARIGEHDSPLNYRDCVSAMVPERYPSSTRPIVLGIGNLAIKDSDQNYWPLQENQLKMMFERDITPLRAANGPQHFSIFALAPMPILIRLGTLLGNIFSTDVYQRRRNPEASWKWLKKTSNRSFQLTLPDNFDHPPVLNLSISGTITNDRIHEILGEEVNIWTIKSDIIDLDCMESKVQLERFKQLVRKTFDQLKAKHGQKAILSIFPAMPVSCAVEFGRAWMAKSDLSMDIFDQNKTNNSFIKTLSIH